MALTAIERLEAEQGLTASDLQMDDEDFARRSNLWEQLAAERTDASDAQRQAHVQYLALGAWITSLIGQADKFRAEGDITVERNIMSRVNYLKGMRDEALIAAGLKTADAVSGDKTSANPSPMLLPYGIATNGYTN